MYYKRANDRRWKGLTSILGEDNQQVLVKHGSHYIRIHSCRLNLEITHVTIQIKNESTQETQLQQKQHNPERQHTVYDSDSQMKHKKTARQIQTQNIELKMICAI